MKSLFLSLLVFGSVSAFAGDLPAGTIGIYDVAGKLSGHSPLCPPQMTCITNGTIVSLTYTGGCLDSLIQPVYEVIGNDVFVHAQIAANEASRRVRCAALPIFTDSLQLIMKFPPLKIHFLGTNEVIEIK